MTKVSPKFTSTIDVYDKFPAQFTDHFERKLDLQEIEKFLAMIPPGGKILEAGCGSARDSAEFIRRGFDSMGIDISVGLLDEAKKRHPEVPTQVMSLTEITFGDELFDGVWNKAALLHIERKDVHKLLADFYRILKPGGALFIQTKAGEGEGTQPVPFDGSLERMFTFFTQAELEKLVKDAGFILEESYDFNGKKRHENSRDQDWVVILAKKEVL